MKRINLTILFVGLFMSLSVITLGQANYYLLDTSKTRASIELNIQVEFNYSPITIITKNEEIFNDLSKSNKDKGWMILVMINVCNHTIDSVIVFAPSLSKEQNERAVKMIQDELIIESISKFRQHHPIRREVGFIGYYLLFE